jgi:hypothetical protein
MDDISKLSWIVPILRKCQYTECDNCPYADDGKGCVDKLVKDAADIIERVLTERSRIVPVMVETTISTSLLKSVPKDVIETEVLRRSALSLANEIMKNKQLFSVDKTPNMLEPGIRYRFTILVMSPEEEE